MLNLSFYLFSWHFVYLFEYLQEFILLIKFVQYFKLTGQKNEMEKRKNRIIKNN